tara:strand:- start:185 stop:385 length:201 start_codon:yes stop_codon:yes gene_type:complete
VSVFAAIIVLCINDDIKSCQVVKNPYTFYEQEKCEHVLAAGLQFFKNENPYKLEGMCIKFPIGVRT